MARLVAAMAAFALLAGGPASPLQAQSAQGILKSGNVYHAAVCPGSAGPGAARCHARIVTDEKGNPLIDKKTKAPKIGWTPFGAQPNRSAA